MSAASRGVPAKMAGSYMLAGVFSVMAVVLWMVQPELLPAWLGILLVSMAWPLATLWSFTVSDSGSGSGTEHSIPSSPNADLNTLESDRELWRLVIEIDALIAPEMAEVRELVAQASDLVAHAASDLQGNFSGLTETTETQQALVSQLVAASATDVQSTASAVSDDVETLNAVSARVQEHISAAVRLLQFDDITRQVLQRVQLRIDFMERFVAELRQLPLVEPGHSAAQVDQARQRLQTLRKELRDAVYRPVSQTSMNEGEIELF